MLGSILGVMVFILLLQVLFLVVVITMMEKMRILDLRIMDLSAQIYDLKYLLENHVDYGQEPDPEEDHTSKDST